MKIPYHRNISILVLVFIIKTYGDQPFRIKDVSRGLVRSIILDGKRKKTLAYYRKSYIPVMFSRLRDKNYISYVNPEIKGWGGYIVTDEGRKIYEQWQRDRELL